MRPTLPERPIPIGLVKRLPQCQTSVMEQQSTERSSLYRLIERQLGEDLADYVSARRPAQSWRAIAAALGDRIGVEVSHESLRLWFSEDEESVA